MQPSLRACLVCAAVSMAVVTLAAQRDPDPSAGAPMRIAVMVDTSDGAAASLIHIRAGLAAFVDALPAGHELLLVSTGRRSQVRVPPTTDYEKVKQSVKGLLTDGGPTPLMDALVEIDERFMRARESRAPVFVIVTGDGSESSSRADEQSFNAWLHAIAARHVVAHAVVIKSGNGFPEAIAAAVVQATGGHYDVVGPGAAVREKLKALGELMGRERRQPQGGEERSRLAPD